VLSQERYLQHDQSAVEACELGSSGDYECSSLNIPFETEIKGVKVVSWRESESEHEVRLMLYGSKEVLYCTLARSYLLPYSLSVNYHIRENTHPDFSSMSIRSLHFDRGYTRFLVLRLVGDASEEQKVVIYDKPLVVTNSFSKLIGHVIEVFDGLDL
jgi:hypothetical protein